MSRIVTQDEARVYLTDTMGYQSLDEVPAPRLGNEYLTALKRIAQGEFKGRDFNTVQAICRHDNRVAWARAKKEGHPLPY